jgi:uncharacterized iron-regulated membrane protein
MPHADSRSPSRHLYAALWRWHFYAGLFTAPFLLILSITGAIYLFNDELNDALYPQLRFAPSGDRILPAGRLVQAARHAYPGARVTRIDMPVTPGRTAMVFVTPTHGEPLRVFVDPGDARVLGDFIYTHTLVGFADVAHGSLLIGDLGDAIVELAASWALVLVVTGLYLWWSRRRRPRAGSTRRWRRFHRLTGVYSAALILFLIITGLPWATVWGGQFLTPISNALGLGYPAQLQHHGQTPRNTLADTLEDAPWTLQQAPVPTAGHSHRAGGPPISIDQVHGILAAHGIPHGYRLSLPQTPTAVYSAITYPDRPEGQRTLHIDPHSGAILAETGFQDYGAIAKLVEWGVALHMGNYFGRLNQLIMLFTCLAIITLVITGLTSWWHRRPPGRLGAPPALAPASKRNLALITGALLLFLPLAGASLVLVLTVEWLLRRLTRC